jgi:aminoglycoside 6'-N-acetyltransferase I
MIEISDLNSEDENSIQQTALILINGFGENWPNSWPDLDSAIVEIQESLDNSRISRIAKQDDIVLGWIGGIPEYRGIAWELHPLVVHPDYLRQGIGRSLVEDLEMQVRIRGGLTIFLGTDDENNMTTLAGKDLYPNVFEHIRRIQNLHGHPYEFYLKLNYVIVGVIPDANGLGKPDIIMAKRIV